MRLDGKRVIVTGGAKGIAAGCVLGYVRAGATVVFCDVDDTSAETILEKAREIEGSEGKIAYYHCDIANKEEVDEFFDKAEEFMGGLDVLANVAGVERNMPATEFKKEDLDFVFGVNINGTIYTNQAAYRLFTKHGVEGCILNYASDTAHNGMVNGGAYAASKGAVISWTRTITKEWGASAKIRCNCINPAIKTPMYEHWCKTVDPKVREAYQNGFVEKYPSRHDMGDCDKDLVPYMIFLSSDDASFITGQIIGINGGLSFSR